MNYITVHKFLPIIFLSFLYHTNINAKDIEEDYKKIEKNSQKTKSSTQIEGKYTGYVFSGTNVVSISTELGLGLGMKSENNHYSFFYSTFNSSYGKDYTSDNGGTIGVEYNRISNYGLIIGVKLYNRTAKLKDEGITPDGRNIEISTNHIGVTLGYQMELSKGIYFGYKSGLYYRLNSNIEAIADTRFSDDEKRKINDLKNLPAIEVPFILDIEFALN